MKPDVSGVLDALDGNRAPVRYQEWRAEVEQAATQAALEFAIAQVKEIVLGEECLCADAELITELPAMCAAHRKLAELERQRSAGEA